MEITISIHPLENWLFVSSRHLDLLGTQLVPLNYSQVQGQIQSRPESFEGVRWVFGAWLG